MREAFTKKLGVALDEAQKEARKLNQDFVGTEHLLLGLVATGESEGVAGLQLGGVDLAELREKLVAALPRVDEPPVVTGTLPLSPKANRVVNTAIVKAKGSGSPRVSTRLLLVSLIEECETGVRTALREAGADLDHLARVLQDSSIQSEK